MMSQETFTRRDTFTFLMYHFYGYTSSHLRQTLGGLSRQYEYQKWFSDGKDDQVKLEKELLALEVESMKI